jgi:hypothetical protein
MFKQILFCAAFITSAFPGSVDASGAEYGTAEEAKAMLNRAIVEVKADKARAIAKFNHNDRQFRYHDLFVFCFNGQDGKFTAHEAMVTRDVRTFQDEAGKRYGEEMYKRAKEGQIVEITFMSPIPGLKEKAPKRSFVTRIGDQVCGVSVYQFNVPGEPTL